MYGQVKNCLVNKKSKASISLFCIIYYVEQFTKSGTFLWARSTIQPLSEDEGI